MKQFFAPYFKEYSSEDDQVRKATGLQAGYYLVKDDALVFISKVVDLQALVEVAGGSLGEDTFISKSLGTDKNGDAIWLEGNQSWRFV